VIRAAHAATESEAERLNLAAVEANDQLLLGSFAETIKLWRAATSSVRHASLDDGVYRLTQPAIIGLTNAGLVEEAANAYAINVQLRSTSSGRHPLVATAADVWWAASATLAGAGQRVATLLGSSWSESVRTDNAWLRPVWALPLSMARWLDGDLEAAEQRAREALNVLPGLDEVRALAGYALIRVQLLRGDLDGASTTAEAVMREGSPTFQAYAAWLQAARSQLCLARQPSVAVARREIAAMVSSARHAAELGQVVPATWLYHDAMRLSPTLDVRPALARFAESVDAPVVQIVAQHAESRAQHDVAGLRRVAQWAESSGLRILAVAALDDALALSTTGAERAAAAVEVAAVRSRCSGFPPENSPALDDRLGLTGREFQVAAAAAAGFTDREIAEQLFVSVRTINAQLGSVYRKLGIEGRRALRTVPGLRTHGHAPQQRRQPA
jgi:ATP/maltotriose-dependent transcriptional regulator MalT